MPNSSCTECGMGAGLASCVCLFFGRLQFSVIISWRKFTAPLIQFPFADVLCCSKLFQQLGRDQIANIKMPKSLRETADTKLYQSHYLLAHTAHMFQDEHVAGAMGNKKDFNHLLLLFNGKAAWLIGISSTFNIHLFHYQLILATVCTINKNDLLKVLTTISHPECITSNSKEDKDDRHMWIPPTTGSFQISHHPDLEIYHCLFITNGIKSWYSLRKQAKEYIQDGDKKFLNTMCI